MEFNVNTLSTAVLLSMNDAIEKELGRRKAEQKESLVRAFHEAFDALKDADVEIIYNENGFDTIYIDRWDDFEFRNW